MGRDRKREVWGEEETGNKRSVRMCIFFFFFFLRDALVLSKSAHSE